MLQTFDQCFKVRFARRQAALEPVCNFHVRQSQELLQSDFLASLKCSAVRIPKATQPEIKFQQSTAATPTYSIGLGMRAFMCFSIWKAGAFWWDITFVPSPACVRHAFSPAAT